MIILISGDFWVDWIGISDYNYARDQNTGATVLVTPDALTSPNSVSTLNKPAFPFYSTYVQQTNKPFILSETGSPIESNLQPSDNIVKVTPTSAEEVAVKQAWWNAILTNAFNGQLPRLKMAVWFEITKPESSYQRPDTMVQRDFRITSNSAVAQAFSADMGKLGDKITKPGKFVFSCAGDFNFQ